ncbi:MAG: PIN domain-containing protein [Planctomycetes bacterium]|nr:PIN domain-containing protein [Planctomycetota bacterium]MBM4084048.1 PIN domain-containing protein [Planctomycetota bacterium]
MTYRAEEISNYVFKSTDKLLLDTNVWLFIHGPSKPADKRTAVYSGAYRRMLAAKSTLCIDVLIASEFVNAYARLRHKLLSPRIDFKQFRKSAAFKPIASAIAADLERVLRHCVRMESGFDKLDINAILNEYGKGDSDFNDQVLVDLCKRNDLKLVTHDGDFRGLGITVVTANRHLLI